MHCNVRSAIPSPRRRRAGTRPSREQIVWCLLAGAVVVALVASTFGSIGADQTCFAYAAWRLLQGDRPGVELWELKPPLHVYYYAAFFRVFGVGEPALLTADVALQLAGMVLFAAGAARRGAARLGITTALAYGALYFFVIPHADHGEVEALANGLTLAGCGIMLAATTSAAAWAAAGCLVGMTFWTKVLPPAFGTLFGLLIAPADRRWRQLVALAGGIAVGIGGWWLLWQTTGDGVQVVRDLRDAMHLQAALENPAPSSGIVRLLIGYAIGWATVTAVLAAGVEWSRATTERIAGITVVAWLGLAAAWTALAAAIVLAQGKFYGYQFLPLLLPMALLTGISHAARRTGARTRQRIALGIAAAVAVGLVLLRDHPFFAPAVDIGCGRRAAGNVRALVAALSHHRLEAYRNALAAQEVEEPPRAVRVEVGHALARLTRPEERILFLDSGETAFWSRRPSWLRYFFPLPVQRAPFDPVLSARVGTQLRAYPGTVVVWQPGWLPPGTSPDVDALLADFTVAQEIGPYRIMVRRP